MSSPEPIVSARDLRKHFGPIEAVRGISFDVYPNECYGFLGPNGAGKTTAMKMIYCYVYPTSGDLRVLGYDVRKDERTIKAKIGVVPQENNLDPDLNVLENLLVYSRYFDIPSDRARSRALELLDFLSIDQRRREHVEKLSGGMKRRLVIARAMINNPRLLILDEPTTGLDPQARHLIWQRLRELKRRGVTMILSTHYMEEAEQLCDRLALMDSGLIVEEGNPQELIKRYVGKEVFEVRYAEPRKVLSLLCGLSFKHEVAGDTMYIYSQDGQEIGKRLMEMPDAEILHRRANLEDVFFRLTGKDLKD
jgi:lipooligosaccharide transport system ATP-binding protein